MNTHLNTPKPLRMVISVKSNKQNGFTLIEMLVIFAVIGVLIAAARYGYALVFASKAQGDTKLMDYAMECARSTYSNSSSYAPATIAALANNNCFPPSLVTGRGTATATVANKYGGLITVTPSNVNGVNDGLEFSEPGVPSDVCVERLKLATKPVKITVTPQGGSEVVVMAIGAGAPDLSLSTSCGTDSTATMKQTITKN